MKKTGKIANTSFVFLLNLKLVLGVVHELRRFRIFGPPLSVWHFLPYERWQKSGHLWTTYTPKPTPLVNVVCERPLKEDTFMWEVSLIIIETTIIPGRKCFGQDMCSTWLIRNAKKNCLTIIRKIISHFFNILLPNIL